MNEELIAQAHWYADKIPAYGDYAKGAADVLRKLADALEAAQPKDPCSTCGAQVNHYRNGCPGCGAPVCCESCCRADNLRGELAYQLTKQLVIDIPTARAAVDAAFRASTEAAQPAGEPVAWQSTFLGESILTADQKNGNYFAYSDEFLASHTIQLYTHPAPQVPMTDDLAALVSRLARALGKASPQHELPIKAMRYLTEKDLLSGPWLRSKDFGATIEEFNAGLCAVEAHHKIGVKA